MRGVGTRVLAAPFAQDGSARLSALALGFALLGDSLFSDAKKVSKNACPCIRPIASLWVRSLRRRSGGRRTRAIHGPLRLSRHPCRSPLSTTTPFTLLKGRLVSPARPYKKNQADATAWSLQTALPLSLARNVGWKTAQHFPPLATSKFSPGHGGLLCKTVGKLRVTHPTDLAPHRAESIRPPERSVRRRLLVRTHENKRSAWFLLLNNFQTTRARFPFRRPSVGAAQGDARHGCRARSDGTWMSLRDAPRSSTGGREVLRSKTRMQGWPSFWLLFLGHTRKSDAPCEAQPVGGAEESAAPHRCTQATADTHCIRKRQTSSPDESYPLPHPAAHLRINPKAVTPPSRGEHP
ncbi:hypothetical protein FIU84_18800 [Stutzerimonas frequens]|nr:hypothetical protein FIU84_18800 [Stutzerimonas frequens]